MLKIRTMVPVLLCALMAVSVAVGQDRGDRGDRGQRGGDRAAERGQREGGQRGNIDPQQMRQRMTERLKAQLQATDEEWQVLEPRINRVTQAQMQMRGGGGWARGGQTRGADAEQANPLTTASRELREVLQNEQASGREIAQKLAAYRAAREKAQADLEEARNALKEVLTPRQEAVLVMSGMLE